MYSYQLVFPQHNYCFTQYYNAPAYSFGEFFVSPLSIGDLSNFPISPFQSQKNEAISESPIIKIENIQQNPIKKQKRQMQQKDKLRTQVCIKKNKSIKKRKNKKSRQKDDRNVVSNLLKIFFKNLIDLHKWDQYLKILIQRYKFQTSLKRFFEWLTNFQVNYRNYIKAKEIKDLLAVQHCRDHQLMFRAVLKRFVYLQGLPHCLTARRIDRGAVRRHVQGIRQLQDLARGNKS